MFLFFRWEIIFKNSRKSPEKLYFLAVLSILAGYVFYGFQAMFFLIHSDSVKRVVAVNVTVSSFMSTNNVRKVTKNSRKNVFFRSFVIIRLDMYIILFKQCFPHTY